MPWPKDHKAKTRERIVASAAAAFRSRGVDGVGVEEIMAAAGLTHGGFYAHFAAKDELVAAALAAASAETIGRLSAPLAATEPRRRLHAVIDTYLSREHAEHPEHGCPVAALGPEVARAGGHARRDLAAGVRRRLAWMSGLVPSGRSRPRDQRDLIAVLACMVGGLILARLAGGRASAAILESCRSFLHRALDEA